MWSLEEYRSKEEKVMDDIMSIAKWWHKWEEVRDGKTVVVIEYEPDRATTKTRAIISEGSVE